MRRNGTGGRTLLWHAVLAAVFLFLSTAGGASLAQSRSGNAAGIHMSPTPLEEYDYCVKITPKGLNRLFRIGKDIFEQRKKNKPGSLEDFSAELQDDGRLRFDGIVKFDGMVKETLIGKVKFHFLGRMTMDEPNVFKYTLDELSIKRYRGSTLSDISMKLMKPVLVSILGIIFNNRHITDYLEIDTDITFTPLLGNIMNLLGKKRVIRIKLKPSAYPTKLLENLHVLHCSQQQGRIVFQGTLKEE